MSSLKKRLTVLLRADGDDLGWRALPTQRSRCDVNVVKSVRLKLLQRMLRYWRNRFMTVKQENES